MKKKTILFLYNNECFKLPPFLTIIDSLKDKFSINIISNESANNRQILNERYKNDDVSFVDVAYLDNSSNIKDRLRRKVKRTLHIKSRFYKTSIEKIQNIQYDLLWVIHESTLFEFKDYLRDKKYITTLYELNDTRADFLNTIKSTIKNARETIVCEENRAAIIRTWCGLDKTPTVVPNKPLEHPRKRFIPNQYESLLRDKKIIIYQGVLIKSRNLGKLCEAIKELQDYTLVLLCPNNEYVENIKKQYHFICHIGFVNPPLHLNITSFAHIAVAKYDYTNLNAVFCAPNKTWEYSGFGIPMLCNDVPGLINTVGRYQAGVCTDLNDITKIKNALIEIDNNYSKYSQNAIDFYESYDIKMNINAIVDRNI